MSPIVEQLLAAFILEGVRAAQSGDAERLKRATVDMAAARAEAELVQQRIDKR